MGKSDIRILPPLVNGKLSGVLEFGVDHVEITEKLLKNEDSSFLVQIIWWGETKHLLIRSKKIIFFTNANKQVIVDEEDGYIVKYEIRTKTKLFKSYLSKCEELEVSVIDSVKNEIIGSAVLKDLIHLVYNVESFTNPLVSDSGDVIGEITCHFKFHESGSDNQSNKLKKSGFDLVQVKEWNNNGLKINLNLAELYTSRDDYLNFCESSRTNKEHSEKSVNVHYNSPVARISGLSSASSQTDWKEKTYVVNADSWNVEQTTKELGVCAEKEIKYADPVNYVENMIPETAECDDPNKKTISLQKVKVCTRKDESPTRNPIVKDSAKVTNKKASATSLKDGNVRRLPKKKPNTTEKTVTGTKKDKAKPSKNLATMPKCNSTSTKSVVKPVGKLKTFTKVSSEISKLNKLYLNGDLENVPVKESSKDENNKKETNEEEQRITCEHSESAKDMKNVERDKTDCNDMKISEKINVNNKLFFDLNDPIEKLYYETFFRKTETLDGNEFEIAELLNQPENKYILETNNQDGTQPSIENKPQTKSDVIHKSLSPVDVRRVSSSSNDEEADRECQSKSMSDELEVENSKTVKEYKSDCRRCKYYKKLSELDKIIDALKNFEAKLKTEDDSEVVVLTDDHHQCSEVEILPENDITGSSEPGDMGVNSNESDYSKEDSDFIEFRRYLSKR